MNKKGKIMAVAALLVLVLAGVLAAVLIPAIKERSMQRQYAEQMDLGNRYLLEQDYEAAVLAFGKAIEIDPRQAESYQKMAEAYVGLGDYENAILTLEKGYEATGEESLKEEKERLETEWQMKERWNVLLERLHKACQAEDEDQIYEIMGSDEYHRMKAEMKLPLFYPDRNGTAMGIYNAGVYFGGLVDGVRSGKGRWYVREWANERYIFTGQWADDYPNGEGEEVNRQWGTYSFPDEPVSFYSVVKGNYRDGYADGEMTDISTDIDNGDTFSSTFHYKVNYGVPEIIGEKDGEAVIAYDEHGLAFIEDSPGEGHFGVWYAMKGYWEHWEDAEEEWEKEWEMESGWRDDGDFYEEPAEGGSSTEGQVHLITNQIRAGVFQYNPERNYFMAGVEYAKGADCVDVLMNQDGDIIASGYSDAIWMTENGYMRIKYCYGNSDQEAQYNAGEVITDIYRVAMGEIDGCAYAELYDWSGNLVERQKLGEDWRYWHIEAEKLYPRKEYSVEHAAVICELDADGFVVRNLDGEEIGSIRIEDADRMEPIITGNLLELRDKETTECEGVYRISLE